MRLGLYTFASLALIGLVAVFVYTINSGHYLLDIAGISISLPIAIWVVVPMLVLLIVTITHMMYYGTRGFFARRKWVRDANELQDAIYWSLLCEPKEHNYSIENIKNGASLLSVSSLIVNENKDGLSDKLGKTLVWINKINNGEYIDLAEKKVAKFMSKENPLVIKNGLNRLELESTFAEMVMSDPDRYDKSVLAAAVNQMAKTQTLFKVRKFIKLFTREDMNIMLDRSNRGEDIGLNVDNVEFIVNSMSLKCPDFMRLAKSMHLKLTPDENLKIFKKLSDENESAQNAYLFLLFKYEMLDAAKSYLEMSGEEEFISFRALYILKKEHQRFRSADIINNALVCNEN